MDDNQQQPATNPGPAEESQSLGAWLREQRAKKKISLEEIAAVTKIHITQLKNIEEDKKQDLPAPAFVRGFLVSYARHLNLDVNEVLQRYKKSWGHVSSLEEPTSLLHNSPYVGGLPTAAAPTTPAMRPKHAATKDLEQKGQFFLTPKVLFTGVGIFIFLILISVLIAIGKRSKSAEAPVVVSPTEQVATPPAPPTPEVIPARNAAKEAPVVPKVPTAPVAAVAVAKAPTPVPVTPPPAVAKKFQLEVIGVEQTWLGVRVDDDNSQQHFLKPGSKTLFQADRRMMLSLSDAGAVELKWNGTHYAAPGYRGDVKSLTLPDDLAKLVTKAAKPRPKPAPAAPAAAPATPAAPVAPKPAGT